jgi:hypothetical protein
MSMTKNGFGYDGSNNRKTIIYRKQHPHIKDKLHDFNWDVTGNFKYFPHTLSEKERSQHCELSEHWFLVQIFTKK